MTKKFIALIFFMVLISACSVLPSTTENQPATVAGTNTNWTGEFKLPITFGLVAGVSNQAAIDNATAAHIEAETQTFWIPLWTAQAKSDAMNAQAISDAKADAQISQQGAIVAQANAEAALAPQRARQYLRVEIQKAQATNFIVWTLGAILTGAAFYLIVLGLGRLEPVVANAVGHLQGWLPQWVSSGAWQIAQ